MHSNVDLIVSGHKYSTVDMPRLLVVVWELRFGFIVLLAYAGARSPNTWGWTVFPWIILVAYFGVRKALKMTRILSDTDPSPPQRDSTDSVRHARLACYGDPVELKSLEDLQDNIIEPVLVPFWTVKRQRMQWAVTIVAICGLVWSTGYWRLGYFSTAMIVVSVSALVVLLCRLTSRFYRVVPGRIEILARHWLDSKVTLLETVSLRNSAVTCRFDKRMVEIGNSLENARVSANEPVDTEPSASHRTLDLHGLAAPHAFVEALFRAAVSSYDAPELPRDQLVG